MVPGSRLEARGSRLTVVRGFFSSRLEALSVQGSSLRVIYGGTEGP